MQLTVSLHGLIADAESTGLDIAVEDIANDVVDTE